MFIAVWAGAGLVGLRRGVGSRVGPVWLMVSLLVGALLVEASDGARRASSRCARLSHRPLAVVGSSGGAAVGLGVWVVVAGGGARMLQPIDQHLQADGEPLVAVVDPDMFAQGDQGGEAVGGE